MRYIDRDEVAARLTYDRCIPIVRAAMAHLGWAALFLAVVAAPFVRTMVHQRTDEDASFLKGDTLGRATVPQLGDMALLAAAGQHLPCRGHGPARVGAHQLVGAHLHGHWPLGVLPQGVPSAV